ncbi:uncharacterized [Tachysurus ichikawai]
MQSLTMLTSLHLFYTLFSLPISFALECKAELSHSTRPELTEKIVHVTNSHIHLPSRHMFVAPADGPQLSTACYSARINYRPTFSPATPSEHGVTRAQAWNPQALGRHTAVWLHNSSSSSAGRKRHAWNTGKTQASRQS